MMQDSLIKQGVNLDAPFAMSTSPNEILMLAMLAYIISLMLDKERRFVRLAYMLMAIVLFALSIIYRFI